MISASMRNLRCGRFPFENGPVSVSIAYPTQPPESAQFAAPSFVLSEDSSASVRYRDLRGSWAADADGGRSASDSSLGLLGPVAAVPVVPAGGPKRADQAATASLDGSLPMSATVAPLTGPKWPGGFGCNLKSPRVLACIRVHGPVVLALVMGSDTGSANGVAQNCRATETQQPRNNQILGRFRLVEGARTAGATQHPLSRRVPRSTSGQPRASPISGGALPGDERHSRLAITTKCARAVRGATLPNAAPHSGDAVAACAWLRAHAGRSPLLGSIADLARKGSERTAVRFRESASFANGRRPARPLGRCCGEPKRPRGMESRRIGQWRGSASSELG